MYLGKYFQGDKVVIYHRAWVEDPEPIAIPFALSAPAVDLFRAEDNTLVNPSVPDSGRWMAAYEYPLSPGLFRFVVNLIAGFTAGNYYARVRTYTPFFGVGVSTRYYTFEIEPGGSPYGSVTALAEVVRPDVRFLVTGSNQGVVQRRKNPRVPQ